MNWRKKYYFLSYGQKNRNEHWKTPMTEPYGNVPCIRKCTCRGWTLQKKLSRFKMNKKKSHVMNDNDSRRIALKLKKKKNKTNYSDFCCRWKFDQEQTYNTLLLAIEFNWIELDLRKKKFSKFEYSKSVVEFPSICFCYLPKRNFRLFNWALVSWYGVSNGGSSSFCSMLAMFPPCIARLLFTAEAEAMINAYFPVSALIWNAAELINPW